MAQAKHGDVVRVHYTGKLNNGTVFDSSVDRDPLQFTIGNGEIIPGFEQAVVGMKSGETKTIKIPSEEAYGPHNEAMVLEVDRNEFPADLNLSVGLQLQMQQDDGRAIPVMVIDISESSVTLDANHPLAGKDLIFDIKLV
ncbi:MAG: peptidylprolyl isomerase [Candidatus Brocadia sp. AMX2]|uniref:Peptidyl-prolyl cis-trans isomerase n=1 Tax=Candidatus Brocadia sinica JPN1 TaxID=1197129 RepID=A0ABQ0JWX0_9BACT|nr:MULTISPECIES: peptidylprolyl isomerase [Brocadia]KXK30349.1 MAG: peptidylprolyl isomerase [Candidatus Brocadia sinica]MBC6931071.1 peptidylprolyl isomerase [Candidatus Brocadia sp.]MBL1168152.1 peptidylprolyl isomerase [Candidatus Brocadia sp. AMX1]NOG40924.1 peptidylprolyl isomerase [Planctomycetota bacterium]KAA0241642.1 MAG: peptidylprolyl isomerase [Candidatus Brocadia sp. AMX2]